MVEEEHARPLAPALTTQSSTNYYENESGGPPQNPKKSQHHRKTCLKCCGLLVALIVLTSVTITILMFTVFRVKDPKIEMKGVTITKLELINGTVPKPGVNMSLVAEVSVKNPNIASFKYSNTTTTLYYRGILVGEARGPPGQAKAWRTIEMNVSVDIIPDKLMSNPNVKADVDSGLLTMSSYSRIGGKVKILKIIKKHLIVKMNCTMSVNISSQAIQEQNCKRKVNF